jgi:hypothetical protein
VNGIFTGKAGRECARIIERLAPHGCDIVAPACGGHQGPGAVRATSGSLPAG